MIKKRKNAPSSVSTGGSNKEFYTNMYGTLLEEAKRQGLKNPEVIAQLGAAQSSLETGYGRSVPGGNYFGIKAKKGGAGTTAKTKEFVNGQMVTVQDKFRQYNNMQESAADYIAFLKQNPRYKNVLNASTIEEAIAAQGRSGYATDPGYATKLASIVGVSAVATETATAAAAQTAIAATGETTAIAAASGSGKSAATARRKAAGVAEQKYAKENKRKKSAKKRIRGEINKLFNKKSGITSTQIQATTEQATVQSVDQTPKKRKRTNSPARVIANVIRSLRSVAKKIKANNESIVNSIEKSASQLSSLKNKNGIQLGSDGGFSPEMIKPQQFTIGDKPYLYYPGGPEGRQIYEASKSGSAGKIAPREIQKQYAKRGNVDVLNKSEMNAMLGTVEDMLDKDTALRKKEFDKLMDYIDTEKPSSNSVFNLEDDEQAAIMEKALTSALENIYRKHPDLLGGGNSGGGLFNFGGGGGGTPSGGSRIGNFFKGLLGMTAIGAGATAVLYGQDKLNEHFDDIIKTSDDPKVIYDALLDKYAANTPTDPDEDRGQIRDRIEKQKGDELMKQAQAQADANKKNKPSNQSSSKTAKPSSKITLQNLKFDKVWSEGKWVDKESLELKPAASAADTIIKGNVENAAEVKKQSDAVISNALGGQDNVAPVTNIIASAPPMMPKAAPESIQTDNKDPAFTNHIHGDGKVFIASSW